MKFDFVIGNPPYQEETDSDSTRKPPIYNNFMDEAYKIADKVELITPARFLFNAGYTPKSWNEKMLNDKHFKVMQYEPNSDKVFAGVEIKGGIAVTYHDKTKDFGAIETFTKYPELNTILKKVKSKSQHFMSEIISAPLNYKLSPLMLKENPNTVGRLRTSAFSKLAEIFFDEEPIDEYEYMGMIGLLDGKRVTKYVRKDYILDGNNILDKYNLLLAKANGAGRFGETLSGSIIAKPGIGYTQTFIGVGNFDSVEETRNVDKYIRGKFARAMLGVLKITQDCPGPKWAYVPVQNFKIDSDIDWSKSVTDIDQQLYDKYGLTKEERIFIETNVKEMD